MEGLSCPRCITQLDKQAHGNVACKACGIEFPSIGGVPFLWAEPGAALSDWRNRCNAALADLEQQIDAATAPASGPVSTQQRLTLLRGALQRHRSELIGLLQPLQVGEALAKETHLALRTRLPSHHGVLSYAQNIHRDWCWGERENASVLEHLVGALRQAAAPAPDNLLVLGCGAGRLAYDLHRSLQPQATWGLDSNPLLSLLGQRMARGDSVDFTEFPLAPVTWRDAAVARTLRAPAPSKGIHFVCADALRLPFADAQFDLIVTPWLLDVIDASVAEIVEIIGRALRPGGVWLNHGSIAFHGADPVNRLTAAELAEITTAGDFSVTFAQDVELPYMQSPASRQQRSEVTYTQVARRGTDPRNSARSALKHQHLPDWIVAGRTPIPLTPAFQTQITTTRIHAFIMSLIDGKRSVRDIAGVLENQRLMPAHQAVAAIRGFLTTMQEEATRQQGRAARG